MPLKGPHMARATLYQPKLIPWEILMSWIVYLEPGTDQESVVVPPYKTDSGSTLQEKYDHNLR